MKSATPINREHATNVGVRNFALLFFSCVLFHIAGTWSLPLIDRDEPRFAEAAREMRERGDYIIPYFNNHFRFDKPPLTYWAQVASYKIFGENDFAARFPSAIAAGLTALSIFVWGSRIRGNRVGWWAAIIFTLSLQTFVHGKAAVADMWLVLFMTLAHWAGWELLRDQFVAESQRPTPNAQRPTSNWKWWSIFYVALAFAFLAKGPIGWTPLLTVASIKIYHRHLQIGARFRFVWGILLMLGIVALWAIPAIVRTQGEFLSIGIGRHVIGRSIATMDDHGANSFATYLLLLPFYFLTVFLSFFPWSIKLPWLTRKLWRNQKTAIAGARRTAISGDNGRDATDNYLIAGAAIIFLLFTLVKTKLPHYTLPAFPLLALLLARALSAENSTGFLKNCAVTTAAIYLAIALLVPPFIAPLFPARELFRQSRDYLRPEMEFAALDYKEPGLVWYFRSRLRGWFKTSGIHPATVQPFMEQRGPRFVILPTNLAAQIYPTLPDDWKRFSTRGFNVVKGRRVDLTLILKPD